MKKAEEVRKKLVYSRKNFWQDTTKNEQKIALKFSEGYKRFLTHCKTERESIAHIVSELRNKAFVDIDEPGVKPTRFVYRVFKNKALAIGVIGKENMRKGINIVASHIDSPRVDLKQSPLHEDKETKLGIMKTHYYGGIKKYQWMSTPLALHGVVIKNDGSKINICIGESDNEPIFIMPDLLPHLSKNEQANKTMSEFIKAGQMNVIFNSVPLTEEKEDITEAVKLQALHLLYDKYGITEEDFLSAELQLVPAGKARDSGLDKSMVAGYGQDDRVCVYTSFHAILDVKDIDIDKTSVVFFFDKEEVGSDSVGGATSVFIEDFIADLLRIKQEEFNAYSLRKTLINSCVISADVNAAINPNFPSVHEPQNAVHLGYGVGICKYTGSGGKSASNDATSEFMARIVKIFNEEKVNWQIGNLGKVDEGGGGTVAKFLAKHGCDVIDIGPGLIGMHSLYELSSKADIYSTYKAYKAFFVKA
ncbi:MAG: aminopeptidase [Candidatus Cloacimonetes bacterium]|nr:aminopeptidase [Candidatus Cloacimonadota bacterium]